MNSRIQGFDLARAFALFGMVIVNFKLVMEADSGSQWLIAMAATLEGRAVALFVVLVGIGITLLAQRALASGSELEMSKVKVRFAKRGVLLMVIGFAFVPVWPADILHKLSGSSFIP